MSEKGDWEDYVFRNILVLKDLEPEKSIDGLDIFFPEANVFLVAGFFDFPA
jgi:hypothetical protein